MQHESSQVRQSESLLCKPVGKHEEAFQLQGQDVGQQSFLCGGCQQQAECCTCCISLLDHKLERLKFAPLVAGNGRAHLTLCGETKCEPLQISVDVSGEEVKSALCEQCLFLCTKKVAKLGPRDVSLFDRCVRDSDLQTPCAIPRVVRALQLQYMCPPGPS